MPFDVDAALEKALACQLLEPLAARALCEHLKLVLAKECNVKPVPAPVTVVGDVHGQVYDVLELFRIGGPIPQTNYLFLGDYVDRGPFSVETITLLALMKLRYPERITLLRGNHESRQITQVYGFYTECSKKFGGTEVWHSFTDLFDYLPIAALIGGSILAVHGGLSPSVLHLDQVRILDRFAEIPHDGPLADLMWSDPDPDKSGFVISPRGAGYVFGPDVVEKFLHLNNLAHIVRAHQLCMNGFQVLFDDRLSTVWSAPNYCYRFGNTASILEISEDLGRFFNIFGPAPESDRQKPASQSSAVNNANGGSARQPPPAPAQPPGPRRPPPPPPPPLAPVPATSPSPSPAQVPLLAQGAPSAPPAPAGSLGPAPLPPSNPPTLTSSMSPSLAAAAKAKAGAGGYPSGPAGSSLVPEGSSQAASSTPPPPPNPPPPRTAPPASSSSTASTASSSDKAGEGEGSKKDHRYFT